MVLKWGIMLGLIMHVFCSDCHPGVKVWYVNSLKFAWSKELSIGRKDGCQTYRFGVKVPLRAIAPECKNCGNWFDRVFNANSLASFLSVGD